MSPPNIIELMEFLRERGWCVVLKCMPKKYGWIIEGSRSEYDAPCEDRQVGKGTWLCECADMSFLKGETKYRGAPCGMDKDPLRAVQKAHAIAMQMEERSALDQ